VFIDRLVEKIKEKNNPAIIGLDPLLEYVPQKIRERAFKKHGVTAQGVAEAITDFNLEIIECTCDLVAAVKPQLAYYELYGSWGIKAFYRTVAAAKNCGMIVIADGKRNDIGSTAAAYSGAYLGETALFGDSKERVFDADALTVNPFLGIDGIKPFLTDCVKFDKGIFVLVKTSNESSGQLQDLFVDGGRRLYEVVAGYVDEWGRGLMGKCGYSSVGAVVGATYPEQARELRKIMKAAYFLVPGYGAQGGTGEDAAAAFNPDGLGAVVSASRSVMRAWKHERWGGKYSHDEFGQAARAEVTRMRDELNAALGG
jgi:orotidine-5'-phosphate decarboxylase